MTQTAVCRLSYMPLPPSTEAFEIFYLRITKSVSAEITISNITQAPEPWSPPQQYQTISNTPTQQLTAFDTVHPRQSASSIAPNPPQLTIDSSYPNRVSYTVSRPNQINGYTLSERCVSGVHFFAPPKSGVHNCGGASKRS